MSVFTFNIIKIFFLSALAAVISLFWAPLLINFLYKFKFWKRKPREKAITGEKADVFYNLHKEREVSVPRGGGVLIWLSVLIIIFFFFALSQISDIWWLQRLNFLSRGETWLPLFTLVAGSLVGLFDDLLTVYGKGKYVGGGLSFKTRLLIIITIGFVGGWWFFYKLGWDTISIPLIFNFPEGIKISIGLWYIPLFILVMVASWTGGIIDGLDGLAGGHFASIFVAFAIIALSQGKVNLASFCGVIAGTLFTFLWFNIPPARFYMGETGILGLTSTMTVAAFLTDSVVVLPIIAGLMVIEVSSIILQLLSKKFRNKKIWLATPIHHHFEARGWPSYKITMRFWIIGIVLAILGVAIRLLSQNAI
jgi:phospho-N-acetylmuramoyl-pentapeptide-transferase